MKKINPKVRKALLTIVCALALVAISVGATVAYLASTDVVTNTFTVGKVVITLDESDVYEFGQTDIPETKTHGEKIDEAPRVQENTYKLFPGKQYDKDPIVHVDAASEDCYVFIEVVNEIAAIEDATKIADQIIANGWTKLENATGATGDVYYKVSNKADTDRELEVFATVKIKGTVDNTTLADYENKTVKVTAYAIQKDGFADAAAAWNAGNVSASQGGWIPVSTN